MHSALQAVSLLGSAVHKYQLVQHHLVSIAFNVSPYVLVLVVPLHALQCY